MVLPDPKAEKGGLIEVAFGDLQPPRNVSHFAAVDAANVSVSIDSVVAGWEDEALPIPRPDFGITTLGLARGSFVTWPRKWVRLLKEVRSTHYVASCVFVALCFFLS